MGDESGPRAFAFLFGVNQRLPVFKPRTSQRGQFAFPGSDLVLPGGEIFQQRPVVRRNGNPAATLDLDGAGIARKSEGKPAEGGVHQADHEHRNNP